MNLPEPIRHVPYAYNNKVGGAHRKGSVSIKTLLPGQWAVQGAAKGHMHRGGQLAVDSLAISKGLKS
jgi:hypothetical protein